MTVDEILRVLTAAFPTFNAKAMEAWAAVYRAQLERHEGPALRDAHVAVMGAFKPSGRTPFPVPAEYAAHLPSVDLHKELAKLPGGKAIDFKAHRQRKDDLVREWEDGQGRKIKQARGSSIWVHCWLTVKAIAQMRAWSTDPPAIVLTQPQIDRCEAEAVSNARCSSRGASVLRFGSNAEWDGQMAEVRAALRAGERIKPMHADGDALSAIKPSKKMNDRLAQLATAWRRGEPPPPVEPREVPEMA